MTDKPEKTENAMPLIAAVGISRGTLLDSDVEFRFLAGRVVMIVCPFSFDSDGPGWPYAELTRDVAAGEEITPENAVLRAWRADDDVRPVTEPQSWRQKPGLL